MDTEKPIVNSETQQRHEASKQHYPLLNLSEGEYVISEVRRHPIGVILPLTIGTVIIGLLLSLLFNYDVFASQLAIEDMFNDTNVLVSPIWGIVALVALGMVISYYIYIKNTFFLTNESVIQEIQHSLFSKQEQTVSLGNIEDASYTQQGVLQHLFNYGDIRLSTEGDETTYRFSYVANPKNHIAELNNAVEAFKNGRPVEVN